jgi:hypothetical protein
MVGAVLGVGLALALLVVSRLGAAGSPLAAEVRVEVASVGELEVRPGPPRAVLVAAALRPGGGRAADGFSVRNQTGSDLAVDLVARPDSTALDGLLRVRAWAADRLLADTTLEGLRARPLPLRLASGQRARLRLQAWLPREVLSGYEGRLVEVSLVPEVRMLEGSR